MARVVCRGELGNTKDASHDLTHAGTLFRSRGDQEKAQQLLEASRKATAAPTNYTAAAGNGIGSRLLSGAISTAQALAPIAIRALSPMLP